MPIEGFNPHHCMGMIASLDKAAIKLNPTPCENQKKIVSRNTMKEKFQCLFTLVGLK
jgi:hypothetical protein